MNEFKCSIYRAGTSKGICFNADDLPQGILDNKELLSEFLCDALGSPDIRQIDGIGGAHSLTSKVAIVKKHNEEIFYTFAQVDLATNCVDYGVNCGNVSSCVLAFCLDSGIYKANKDEIAKRQVTAKIYNTNSQKYFKTTLKCDEFGKFDYRGDFNIAGVNNSASKITLEFLDPFGKNGLMPTKKPKEIINIDNVNLEVSIFDAFAPCVFVKAEQVCKDINNLSDDELIFLEKIRSFVAKMLKISDNASIESLATPKIAILKESKIANIKAQMISMKKPHPAIAMSLSQSLAYACITKDSIANEISKSTEKLVKIEHKSGISEILIGDEGILLDRTARKLLSGYVYTYKDY